MPPRVKPSPGEFSSYAGRWIARLGERIVGQGGTPEQALWAAKTSRFKEDPQVDYIPTSQPLTFSERLERVRQCLPPDLTVYLVGGAVRDALLGRDTHDMDFVLPAEALAIGRRVADALQGAYYPLDEERQMARVVTILPDGTREVLDFAMLHGPDLESDLRQRDFTVNAMAVDLRQTQALLDPLGGAADLRSKSLRACSAVAFNDDPVRILRGVRLAAEFGLRIQRETLRDMRQAIHLLEHSSPERKRDELFRILEGPQPATAMLALEMIGALPNVLPELGTLKGVEQSPPHVGDVWTHTLDVLRQLEALAMVLDRSYHPDAAANLPFGLVTMRLGRYREQVTAHLKTSINPERRLRALLFLAALYHDVAKPVTRQLDEKGKYRFFDHEQIGAEVVEQRAAALALSNDEITRLGTIVRQHMRPIHLGQLEQPPTRRAIYRFFRDCGEAGVDICLLSMADVLATYGPGMPQEVWGRHLDTIRLLLEAWWEHRDESILPPALLNGYDLMAALDLKPGKQVGVLLETIREAQAAGQISDREAALELARSWMVEHPNDQG